LVKPPLTIISPFFILKFEGQNTIDIPPSLSYEKGIKGLILLSFE
jgi:hypothetical protein